MAQTLVIAVREQIAEQLRSEIISGELAPNTKLVEENLAQRFGVSRGRIRDVLLELSKEGLLVSRANKGTSVNVIAPPELQSLMMQLRLTIEIFAIKKLASSADPEVMEELQDAFEVLSSALHKGDFNEVMKADMAFHRVIVAAAGGEDLLTIWQPIILRMRMNYQRLSTNEQSIAEHRSILEAIEAGDAKSALAALKGNVR